MHLFISLMNLFRLIVSIPYDCVVSDIASVSCLSIFLSFILMVVLYCLYSFAKTAVVKSLYFLSEGYW